MCARHALANCLKIYLYIVYSSTLSVGEISLALDMQFVKVSVMEQMEPLHTLSHLTLT